VLREMPWRRRETKAALGSVVVLSITGKHAADKSAAGTPVSPWQCGGQGSSRLSSTDIAAGHSHKTS